MKKLVKLSLSFVALFALVNPAFAYEHNKTSSGAVLHWKSCLVLHVSDDLPSYLDPDQVMTVVQESVDTWNSTDANVRILLAGWTNSNEVEHIDGGASKNTNILIIRHQAGSWRHGQKIGNASTRFNADTGEMWGCDVEINGVNHQLSLAGAPTGMRIDLQTVFTHEAGHCLGLDHSKIEAAMMADQITLGTGETRHELSTDDENGLKSNHPLQPGEDQLSCFGADPGFHDENSPPLDQGFDEDGPTCSVSNLNSNTEADHVLFTTLLLLGFLFVRRLRN